ncbi:unnamed protein product [Adineta ricciae]|uniref:Dynamin-type G domain-containing protein n=1 Tax=Adineta ricciae TaxID=249248 RepID=A0A814KH13_ADIRI|nr:unnamed protein product [Adineta ricciae]CAF1416556.1 unnamed protein product [Adineta ricciae]
MSTFQDAFDNKVRHLMDKMDQARSLLLESNENFTFPTVVVVGDQSSGKSTLLESLSLVELPKGSGIVTRCPLVLRLRESDERRVYRLYENNGKELLNEKDLNIPQYIEQETIKLAGDSKNIVQDMIELQVEDPHVRNLTVVDLPGIAHTALDGQPKDIHDQIIKLIHRFIKPEESIILCVWPANVDIAVGEAFALAREFDPLGKRTIGVITKTDLATDRSKLKQQLLMTGRDVIRLKLGFVAVRNRSADQKLTLAEAREQEKKFFLEHEVSMVVDPSHLGINALIHRLSDLYCERVKQTFPKLRKEIQARLITVEEQLTKLPPEFKTSAARVTAYNELVDVYIEKILKPYIHTTDYGQHRSMVNRLHRKFLEYRDVIRNQRKMLYKPEYRAKVEEQTLNYAGEQLPNFVASPVLKHFICNLLDELWDYTSKLINDCFRIMGSLLAGEEQRAREKEEDVLLVKLLGLFHNVTSTYLNEKKQEVHDQLKALLQLDRNDPYTVNTYYMETVEKYKGTLAQGTTGHFGSTPTSSSTNIGDDDDELVFNATTIDQQAVKHLLISLYSYWKLLTKRFVDYATLSLRAGCVFNVCPDIRHRLRRIPVERPDAVDKHLSDDDFIRNRREQLTKTKERLTKIHDIFYQDDDDTFIDNDNETTTDATATENPSPKTPTTSSTTLKDTSNTNASSTNVKPTVTVASGFQFSTPNQSIPLFAATAAATTSPLFSFGSPSTSKKGS